MVEMEVLGCISKCVRCKLTGDSLYVTVVMLSLGLASHFEKSVEHCNLGIVCSVARLEAELLRESQLAYFLLSSKLKLAAARENYYKETRDMQGRQRKGRQREGERIERGEGGEERETYAYRSTLAMD